MLLSLEEAGHRARNKEVLPIQHPHALMYVASGRENKKYSYNGRCIKAHRHYGCWVNLETLKSLTQGVGSYWEAIPLGGLSIGKGALKMYDMSELQGKRKQRGQKAKIVTAST